MDGTSQHIAAMIGRVLQRIRLAYYASEKSFHQFESSNPGYQNFAIRCGQCREELRPAYERYVKDVSRADMAASLELGAALLALCRTHRWKKLLDLGSGFSSYVFRLYARESSGVEVYSVDDDAEWLKRTMSYLAANELSTEHLMHLDDFLSQGNNSFDCILHDLNFVEVRVKYVQHVLERLSPEGLLIFDDVHKTDYRIDLMKQLRSQGGNMYSLKPITLDRFGRFSFAYSPR